MYSWREWALCRGRDALYLWSDVAALELSTGSNGWFRYLLDGKLATMYSSGSPEHQTDNTGMSLPTPIAKLNFVVGMSMTQKICATIIFVLRDADMI